jgi:para-nitrobenzyl esterase
MAPQSPPLPTESFPGDPTHYSEDCLFLNVWTAGVDDARRPVMVWIHGGGFTTGSGGVGLYRGEHLARRGVVVVTLNYRLGTLGWLAHPNLAQPRGGLGNWGLLDQIAALTWVRDHIEAFGGDPGNVTVFGESAGAMSVAALLGAPTARSLFRRAAVQSGAAAGLGVASASGLAEDVTAELGLSEVSLEALQRIPVEEILAAQTVVGAAYEGLGLAFQPVVDGHALPRHPAVEIATGAAAGIDLLIGTNRDEWKFFTFTTASLREIDDSCLLRLVSRHIDIAGLAGSVPADELITVVREARSERGFSTHPAELYAAMCSDWIFRVPSMRLAEAHATLHPRTFAYLFDWESPFGDGALGSCHALEIPFVFGTVSNPAIAPFSGSGSEAETLSRRMQAAWVAFAATGDPSTGELGTWPAYEPQRRTTMRLGRLAGSVEAPMESERAWLDAALGPYGHAETAGLEHVRRLPRREAEAARGT